MSFNDGNKEFTETISDYFNDFNEDSNHMINPALLSGKLSEDEFNISSEASTATATNRKRKSPARSDKSDLYCLCQKPDDGRVCFFK